MIYVVTWHLAGSDPGRGTRWTESTPSGTPCHHVAAWSSCMIRAQGAQGSGPNSRNGPCCCQTHTCCCRYATKKPIGTPWPHTSLQMQSSCMPSFGTQQVIQTPDNKVEDVHRSAPQKQNKHRVYSVQYALGRKSKHGSLAEWFKALTSGASP